MMNEEYVIPTLEVAYRALKRTKLAVTNIDYARNTAESYVALLKRPAIVERYCLHVGTTPEEIEATMRGGIRYLYNHNDIEEHTIQNTSYAYLVALVISQNTNLAFGRLIDAWENDLNNYHDDWEDEDADDGLLEHAPIAPRLLPEMSLISVEDRKQEAAVRNELVSLFTAGILTQEKLIAAMAVSDIAGESGGDATDTPVTAESELSSGKRQLALKLQMDDIYTQITDGAPLLDTNEAKEPESSLYINPNFALTNSVNEKRRELEKAESVQADFEQQTLKQNAAFDVARDILSSKLYHAVQKQQQTAQQPLTYIPTMFKLLAETLQLPSSYANADDVRSPYTQSMTMGAIIFDSRNYIFPISATEADMESYALYSDHLVEPITGYSKTNNRMMYPNVTVAYMAILERLAELTSHLSGGSLYRVPSFIDEKWPSSTKSILRDMHFGVISYAVTPNVVVNCESTQTSYNAGVYLRKQTIYGDNFVRFMANCEEQGGSAGFSAMLKTKTLIATLADFGVSLLDRRYYPVKAASKRLSPYASAESASFLSSDSYIEGYGADTPELAYRLLQRTFGSGFVGAPYISAMIKVMAFAVHKKLPPTAPELELTMGSKALSPVFFSIMACTRSWEGNHGTGICMGILADEYLTARNQGRFAETDAMEYATMRRFKVDSNPHTQFKGLRASAIRAPGAYYRVFRLLALARQYSTYEKKVKLEDMPFASVADSSATDRAAAAVAAAVAIAEEAQRLRESSGTTARRVIRSETRSETRSNSNDMHLYQQFVEQQGLHRAGPEAEAAAQRLYDANIDVMHLQNSEIYNSIPAPELEPRTTGMTIDDFQALNRAAAANLRPSRDRAAESNVRPSSETNSSFW